MTRRRSSSFRFVRVGFDAYHVFHRADGVYLGTVTRTESATFPWVAIVTNPDQSPDQPATTKIFGASRDDIAGGLLRHWRDYPHVRCPDPRDGRRDDVPPPEPP